MSITIFKYYVESPEICELYDVTIFGSVIETTVTDNASMVTAWISNHQIRGLVVGLDVQWRPNTALNRVATLHLCAGESCLIFQLLHAHCIPNSLAAFLSDANHTFVGVGIGKKARKLKRDYGLEVENCVDLGFLARARYGEAVQMNMELEELAAQSLGMNLEKPKTITTGRWDKPWLSNAQVKYACVDVFVSYMVGLAFDAAEYTELYNKFLHGLRVNLDCNTN